jgi:hypothetical protein
MFPLSRGELIKTPLLRGVGGVLKSIGDKNV